MGTDCLKWSICASAMAFYLRFSFTSISLRWPGSVVFPFWKEKILCGFVQIDRLQIHNTLDGIIHIYLHSSLLCYWIGETFWFHRFIRNYQGAAFHKIKMREYRSRIPPRRRHRKQEKEKTYRRVKRKREYVQSNKSGNLLVFISSIANRGTLGAIGNKTNPFQIGVCQVCLTSKTILDQKIVY